MRNERILPKISDFVDFFFCAVPGEREVKFEMNAVVVTSLRDQDTLEGGEVNLLTDPNSVHR